MAPKAKNAAPNGSGTKGAKPTKTAKDSESLTTPSATASGKTSPTPPEDLKAASGHKSRPDKAAYDAEQERIKKEIDVLQTKLVRVFSSYATSHVTNVWFYEERGAGEDQPHVFRWQQ